MSIRDLAREVFSSPRQDERDLKVRIDRLHEIGRSKGLCQAAMWLSANGHHEVARQFALHLLETEAMYQ